MDKKKVLDFLSAHKKEFEEKYSINKIGLFGSYSKGIEKKDSDIDILIDMKDNTTNIYEKKQEFKNFLQKKFNTKVDIAREKYLRPIAKNDILKDVIFV